MYYSIKIKLRKDVTTSAGNPIIIQVLFDRKRIPKSLGLFINPKLFNDKAQNYNYCKGENAVQKNEKIKAEFLRVEKALLNLELAGVINVDSIKSVLNSGIVHSNSLFEIGSEYNAVKKLSAGTVRRYEYYCLYLKKTFGQLAISALNPVQLTKMENRMRTDYTNGNTLNGYFRYIRALVNFAIDEKGIEMPYPFGIRKNQYKITAYKNPKRNYLTDAEIEKVNEFCDSANPTIRNTARWFMFQCRSGFRYSDLSQFDLSHIKDGKLFITDKKTETDHFVPMYPALQQSIDNLENKIYAYDVYRRTLSAIGTVIGLSFPLTSHVARHSFSIRYLNNGGSMETLSKLLGHSNTRTTQIYGKITNKRIEDEAKDVFGRM